MPTKPKKIIYESVRTLMVPAYRDHQGQPTCATNFTDGKVCPYYRTQRLGTEETCAFALAEGRRAQQLERRQSGDLSLIPLKQCPVWKGEPR